MKLLLHDFSRSALHELNCTVFFNAKAINATLLQFMALANSCAVGAIHCVLPHVEILRFTQNDSERDFFTSLRMTRNRASKNAKNQLHNAADPNKKTPVSQTGVFLLQSFFFSPG